MKRNSVWIVEAKRPDSGWYPILTTVVLFKSQAQQWLRDYKSDFNFRNSHKFRLRRYYAESAANDR